jgi:hypothetical protein
MDCCGWSSREGRIRAKTEPAEPEKVTYCGLVVAKLPPLNPKGPTAATLNKTTDRIHAGGIAKPGEKLPGIAQTHSMARFGMNPASLKTGRRAS